MAYVSDIQLKQQVLRIFGGVSAVARICGLTSSAVSQWTGVPLKHQRKLLVHAQKNAIDFGSDDFFALRPKMRATTASGSPHFERLQPLREL
jgi:hypothetical protein